LRDAQFLRGQTAAQLLLIGNSRVRDQPENLAVPECLPRRHV
jgi:hypothetical protein